MAKTDGQKEKKQKRTPTIGIKLAATDYLRFNEFCRQEGKNRSEMARKAILFYMAAEQSEAETAARDRLAETLAAIEIQRRKDVERLAKLIVRATLDIGIVNQVFYKRASKEERDKLWDAAKTAAVQRLTIKRKDGDTEVTEVMALK